MSKANYASVADAINGELKKTGKGLHDLATQTGISYEHIRKMSKGEANPSTQKLKTVSEALSLELHMMQELDASDRMKRKFGRTGVRINRKDRHLDLVEKNWPKLTAAHRTLVVAIVNALAQKR